MIALRRQAVPLARNPEALAEHFGVGAAAALPHAEAIVIIPAAAGLAPFSRFNSPMPLTAPKTRAILKVRSCRW